MLHGFVTKLFPSQASTNFCPTMDDIVDAQSREQFRTSLLQTLCEEPAYHYGFREQPGHNVGEGVHGINYRHRFPNSCFLDVLRELIKDLGSELFLEELCARHIESPGNQVIVHNLGMLFDHDDVASCLGTATSGFESAWNALDRAPEWYKDKEAWPDKTTLEERLNGLTLAERLEKMWNDQDDGKLFERYIGCKLNNENLDAADFQELATLLLSDEYVGTDAAKVKRLGKTFKHSELPEFKKLGNVLLEHA